MITFDDFKKLDIRIGTVLSAEKIADADKLLKIIFDLGEEKRQIIAGVAEFFPDPAVLVGQQMPILVNLEPRKFRGHESQGMMLAADLNGKPILLHPESEITPGAIVR